jgi:regulator of replication initiation timing
MSDLYSWLRSLGERGKEAADRLAYYEAQDGLLEDAQQEVKRLHEQLAEVQRPLTEQMQRLNEQVIRLNAEVLELRKRLAGEEPTVNEKRVDLIPQLIQAVPEGQRLGQYFCNTYIKNSYPELYYADLRESIRRIREWLDLHCYYTELPQPIKRG